ncbi:MAG: SUF system NifU family Fe-S cluster assembly protein [Pseudomonadota bacterium]
MSALRELYQEVIIDHSRQPRNFGVLPDANHSKEGFNPLCGDRVTVHILAENDVISKLQFEGCGCAISMASASLMTETLWGKTRAEVEVIFQHFHQLITAGSAPEELLGKLTVLAGVAEFPVRVKCATLPWHTLKAALAGDTQAVCTE